MTASRILVIDDEELLFRTFSRLLRRQGYDVYLARNSDTAFSLARQNSINLILSDILMPGLNGIETVTLILKEYVQRSLRAPRVLFMSGYLSVTLEDKIRHLTSNPIIWKPFDITDFLEKISAQLTAGEEEKIKSQRF